MKKMVQENHQGKKEHSGLSGFGAFAILRKLESYGACAGKDGSPNCSKSAELTPFAMISLSILTGFNMRNLAVLIIVIIKETFVLPCLVMLPKVIFRNRTAFLIPCSAKLLVGSMTGYFRKTKSSFLWTINRFRMLSVSWFDNGLCWYNFLNLLSISFLPERYSPTVKTGCRL